MVEFLDCTGIDELNSISMKIYPNPSNGIFNLELAGESNKPVDVQVMNISGEIVFSNYGIVMSGTNTQKIDISNFADGIYTVSVSSNGASKTRRIVLRK